MEKKNNDDKILSVSFSSKQENQEIEFNLKTSVKDEENAPKISSTDLDGVRNLLIFSNGIVQL